MLERSGELRVYTFTLPKFVSGIVRKCMLSFVKMKNRSHRIRKRGRKTKKCQAEVFQPGISF